MILQKLKPYYLSESKQRIMLKVRQNIIFLLIGIIFFSCSDNTQSNRGGQVKSSPSANGLFTLLSPAETGVRFSNSLEDNANENISTYDYFYNGGGVAAGDVNNDGLVDLYFTGNQQDNELYINKGNLKFENVTQQAGLKSKGSIPWSAGATMVDINQDGFLDIYVCNHGPFFGPNKDQIRKNQLYINNGDGTFTESADAYGLGDISFSTQASFFDYDKDGDLDLFVMNQGIVYRYAIKDTKGPEQQYQAIKQFAAHPIRKERIYNKLYKNTNGKFLDVSKEAGVSEWGFGLGLFTCDLNNDGWTDIYVSNDFWKEDFLYYNNGDGTFSNQIKTSTGHTAYYGMGCDAGDINQDGMLDILAVDMTPEDRVRSKTLMPSMNVALFSNILNSRKQHHQYMFNTLQVNNGNGHFSEIGQLAGISKTDWSWASLFMDADNDRNLDIFITNGFKRDTKNQDIRRTNNRNMAKLQKEKGRKNISKEDVLETVKKFPSVKQPNYFYKNNGNVYEYKNVANEWGISHTSFSNGAVYADLDNDGDLDLVINNIDEPAFIYKNNANTKSNGNYLQVKLEGNKPGTEYNAKVTLKHQGKKLYQEYSPVRGYLGHLPSLLHFGLGDWEAVSEIQVEWLSGKTQNIKNPKINGIFILKESEASVKATPTEKTDYIFSAKTPAESGIDFIHKENKYNDFAKEVLLPHRQSTLGPGLAVGDANGDGLEDFYVGGAKDMNGKLYIQKPDGNFSPASGPWEKDAGSEDLAALFFDADGNGTMDLYVVSGGGGEFSAGANELQDRLYMNSGNGNFKKDNSRLPNFKMSGTAVKANDMDGDGDLDLVVCGGAIPGKYPYAEKTYILKNENGKFSPLDFERDEKGIVRDALWVDFNNDKKPDIIFVGEWMPVSFYRNEGDSFVNVTAEYNLENTVGWWNRIAAEDMDGDGDLDILIGNIGKNNKFGVKDGKPLDVYCTDFDDSGTADIVLSKSYNGIEYPVRGKECSTEQMPFVSQKFPTFEGFANASTEKVYGKDKLETALHFEATDFSHLYLKNTGDGFEKMRLPVETEFAPINGIVLHDFTGDKIPDIVVAGNKYNTEVETARYDAGVGLLLDGSNKEKFEAVRPYESGLFLPGNVKDLKLIWLGKDRQPALLVANNNGYLQIIHSNIKAPVQ